MIKVYNGNANKWVSASGYLKVQGIFLAGHDQFYINNRYYPVGKYDWSKIKYPTSIEISNSPIAWLNGTYEKHVTTVNPNMVPEYVFELNDKNITPDGYYKTAAGIYYDYDDDRFKISAFFYYDDNNPDTWLDLDAEQYYYTEEDFFTKDNVTWQLDVDGVDAPFTITKKYD